MNFTPSTSTTPKITEITALLTNYYKQGYGIFYGVGNYAASDDDTSDPQTLIRSDEWVGEVIAEISTKVQAWHDSGINSNGEVIKMPNFSISKKLQDKMRSWTGQSYDRIENIRVWGNEYDEGEYI